MSMFTVAISCLTTSNLPWLMDLTFQVPMQYCSLQHRTLLPSPVTSTTRCHFCSGSVSSCFLELFLHWSPVAYWAPTNLSSLFSVISFWIFILFTGFSGKNTEVVCHSFSSFFRTLQFCQKFCQSMVSDHILSELSTMSRLSWVALHGMAHSFTELDKAVVHELDKAVAWNNRGIWPWNTKWSRAKANRVLPRECIGHSKHPLPTTQEKTLRMDITRWSILKSDWLYSL